MFVVYDKEGLVMVETNDEHQARSWLKSFPSAAFVMETKVVDRIVAVREDYNVESCPRSVNDAESGGGDKGPSSPAQGLGGK